MIKGKTNVVMGLLLVLLLVLSSVSVLAVPHEGERVDGEDEDPLDDEDLRGTGDDIPLKVLFVKVNGDKLENQRVVQEVFERSETLDINVKIEATEDVDDVSVQAWIAGDDHFPLNVVSRSRNYEAGDKRSIDLRLDLPEITDQDEYQLHVLISGRNTRVYQYSYPIRIRGERNAFRIRDVVLFPSEQVVAGRAFTVLSRIENLGEDDEEGVRVSVSIPQLGVRNSDFIDEVEEDDEVTTEELLLRVPRDAKPGVYDVVVEVSFDEFSQATRAVRQIEVVNDNFRDPQDRDEPSEPQSSGRTVVSVGQETHQLTKGQGGAIYTLSLTNEGSTAKSYTLGVTGVENFGTVQVTPSNVVMVQPSATESVYVYVSAREDVHAGAYAFSVDLKDGARTLQQIPLMANVVEPAETKSDYSGLKLGLEVGLLVLIIILIILGLVVAFTRARRSDGEEELAGQTYY